MVKVKTRCDVIIYERDGKECSDEQKFIVHSHWNRDEMIVLDIDGKKITVEADVFKSAVEKCSGD